MGSRSAATPEHVDGYAPRRTNGCGPLEAGSNDAVARSECAARKKRGFGPRRSVNRSVSRPRSPFEDEAALIQTYRQTIRPLYAYVSRRVGGDVGLAGEHGGSRHVDARARYVADAGRAR